MNSDTRAKAIADGVGKRTGYTVVACETCLDLGRVLRIRGGVEFEEPCPDEEGDDDVFVGWDASAELLDDMRRDDR